MDSSPEFIERRQHAHLSESQIEYIAERAASKAVEKITTDLYSAVGKGVIKRFVWVLGAVVVGGYVWLKNKGVL